MPISASFNMDKILKLDQNGRILYFQKYARYTDSPDKPYMIRVGCKALFSSDTRDLLRQFDRYVLKLQKDSKSKKRSKKR
jgi:hypothetical protein